MTSLEFTSRYSRTLRIDTDTQQPYLKLPISDLNELACTQEALLQAVQTLSQYKTPYKGETNHSVYWLSKILLLSYPGIELEGLSELLGACTTKSNSILR